MDDECSEEFLIDKSKFNNASNEAKLNSVYIMITVLNIDIYKQSICRDKWSSTSKGNSIINSQYKSKPVDSDLYLLMCYIHSCKKKKGIIGLAKVTSEYDKNDVLPWGNKPNWSHGVFNIHWIFIKNINLISINDISPDIFNMKNGTIIPSNIGHKLFNFIRYYNNSNSLLDIFTDL